MPTYFFKNLNTGEETSETMRICDQDEFITNNPHLEIIIKPVKIVSGVGGLKVDAGFKDVLKRIKNASGKNNTIDTY